MKKIALIISLVLALSLTANAQQHDVKIFASLGAGYQLDYDVATIGELGIYYGPFLASIRGGYGEYYQEFMWKLNAGFKLFETNAFYIYAAGNIGYSAYESHYSYYVAESDGAFNYGAYGGINVNLNKGLGIFGEIDYNRNHKFRENTTTIQGGIRICF